MKKSFLKKKKLEEDMSLQITAMADIFVVLLVFLLRSYSSSVSTLSPQTRIELPIVEKTAAEVKETVKLEIAPDTILIDEKPAVKLRNFEFNPRDIEETGQSRTIYNVLYEERKKQPIPNMDSNLLVMADQETPYATLKTVIASASAAGFVDLQLVVVEVE